MLSHAVLRSCCVKIICKVNILIEINMFSSSLAPLNNKKLINNPLPLELSAHILDIRLITAHINLLLIKLH